LEWISRIRGSLETPLFSACFIHRAISGRLISPGDPTG
jgi:hypothetical protein